MFGEDKTSVKERSIMTNATGIAGEPKNSLMEERVRSGNRALHLVTKRINDFVNKIGEAMSSFGNQVLRKFVLINIGASRHSRSREQR